MRSPAKLAPNVWFHSLHVPKWGWLRTGYSGCVLAVRKKLREIQPDLVHAQGTERDCAISAALAPFPWLLTIHGNIRTISKLYRSLPLSFWWLQARLEEFCIPRCQGVVCISTYTQRLVAAVAKKTWLVPNAVDSRFFSEGPHRSPPHPLFLVVAHVTPHKNQIALIQSLDELARTRSFRLRFLGKCGEDDYGRRFLEVVRGRKWCEWGGAVDQEALRKELGEASALILPTMEDNCPMVILEAQASEVPVVASAVGGIPDLIQDGITGLLVDPFSLGSIRDAVEKIMSNGTLACELAARGRAYAQRNFHPKIIAEHHLRIYEEVIRSL